MPNNMIKWIITTSASYKTLDPKNPNALYFLSDTKEIYRGETPFTEGIIMVTTFPAAGAQGKIYMNESTLEGKIWTGTAWKTVIGEIASTLTSSVERRAVSGEAVKSYVASEFSRIVTGNFVEGISYDKATKDITYVKNGATNRVAVDGFVTGASYNGTTGVLTFPVEGGSDVNISLPKENFVTGGSYDKVNKKIVLTLQSGDTIEIPAGDLVDINEFGDTSTINMDVNSTTGIVTATVKVSATAGNTLATNADGLYVPATDISGKLNKVASAKADEIITANADGQVKTSGLRAGAATLSGTPNATTLATEAAVSAIRSALDASIATKIAKTDISTALPATEALSSDAKVLSEKGTFKAIDAAKSALQTNINAKIDKTSITSAIDADAASTVKVVSEKALVDSVSWVVIA